MARVEDSKQLTSFFALPLTSGHGSLFGLSQPETRPNRRDLRAAVDGDRGHPKVRASRSFERRRDNDRRSRRDPTRRTGIQHNRRNSMRGIAAGRRLVALAAFRAGRPRNCTTNIAATDSCERQQPSNVSRPGSYAASVPRHLMPQRRLTALVDKSTPSVKQERSRLGQNPMTGGEVEIRSNTTDSAAHAIPSTLERCEIPLYFRQFKNAAVLKKLAHAGKGPLYQLIGKNAWYETADIVAWLASRNAPVRRTSRTTLILPLNPRRTRPNEKDAADRPKLPNGDAHKPRKASCKHRMDLRDGKTVSRTSGGSRAAISTRAFPRLQACRH